MATTYNNLFLDTRARLRKAGVESAQLEAREIICFAADKSREQFYRDMSLYASSAMEQRVEELVQRRLAGEPVAYIIGEWEFYGLSLDISREVLIPRLDTELLAERGILKARESGEGARVLDLCAGSGCVGLAVAANAPECRVVLADISEGAVRRNMKRCGLDYWPRLDVTYYDSWEDFLRRQAPQELWLATTKAPHRYDKAAYEDGCWLVFGKESAGLPEALREAHRDRCVRIPMRPGERSLNLSNSVAVMVYEALRQLDFPGMQDAGEMGAEAP